MIKKYPQNSIIDLLDTDLVTEPTKKVLSERLSVPIKIKPDFFSEEEYRVLIAVSSRLLPQEGDRAIDLAGLFDTSMMEGNGNGWRYDRMPADEESFRNGMAGVEQTAMAMYDRSFDQLTVDAQDEVLTVIQHSTAPGLIWRTLPSDLFFEELLVALTEIYYSHPYGREEIGDLSAADKPGWRKIGLDQLEDREPRSI